MIEKYRLVGLIANIDTTLIRVFSLSITVFEILNVSFLPFILSYSRMMHNVHFRFYLKLRTALFCPLLKTCLSVNPDCDLADGYDDDSRTVVSFFFFVH